MPADPVYFLLVDDLEENLLSLEALLRKDGLILLKARSGLEALELLLQYDIALALLDVQMPNMDGFELAELMRGNERTGRVPIIFLTAGLADRQRRFRGYEAGAVDFINKPIEPDVLRSKADVFFQLRQQHNQLTRQRDELHEAVAENARLLAESRQYAKALQEADKNKDEFLATLAHELRNPLAPLRNGLEIMRMSPDMAETEDLRDMMDRQLGHMIRLIDDLLDVSRISQGKVELQRQDIDAQSALRDAIETARPFIEAQKHQLVINMPDEAVFVHADLTRLAQIIGNLLNNAAKYTPEGGHIQLDVTQAGDTLSMAVSDNGLGIAEEVLPRIFDLFMQVESKENQGKGGLGIGLALVRRLVEMHNGAIRVESAGLGQGSTFTVEIPIIEAPATVQQEPASAAETTPARVMNILVVDDNLPSAETIGCMLELIGHTVTLAHGGAEAIEKTSSIKPDAVLLDIGLPDISGYDVCREIRSNAALSGVLMIAQTGWGQKRDIERAIEAGFDHHLVKPISLEDLQSLLGEAA